MNRIRRQGAFMNKWALLYAGGRKQTAWETRFRYGVWSGGAKAGGWKGTAAGVWLKKAGFSNQAAFLAGCLLYSVRKSFILFSEQTAVMRRNGKTMPEGTI